MSARRPASVAALVLALLALLAPATAPAAPPPPATRTSLPDIEDEVMCVVCGVPLNVATESPQAMRERAFIQARIAAGDSKEQIKRALVDQYGPAVLALPRNRGFDATAYLVPIAAGAAALLGVALLLPRWRRRHPGASGHDGLAPALTPGDARRLEEDLARFDA